MDKNAIKKYAIFAREELIKRVSIKAEEYGVSADVAANPNATTIGERVLSSSEIDQRRALINTITDRGYNQVIEEIAYTWFNRFIALRFMEVNNYLPSKVRVFTNENNEFKPQILDEALHMELEGLDKAKVIQLKDENKSDELYKYLLITQCNALHECLPQMFQRINDYTELLFPDNLRVEGSVIEKMINTISQNDLGKEVEIIGWLYQFYNSKIKDNLGEKKVHETEVPAATQMFTPKWIVRYMVQNSLGQLAVKKMGVCPEKMEWEFYLNRDENSTIKDLNEKINLLDLKIIDPCMGSGHILVYVFDVLVQLYRYYGYSDRDAVSCIMRNNIFGLDIDNRASQLSYFAIMMKGLQYDKRFLSRTIEPQVYSPKKYEEGMKFGSLLKIEAPLDKPCEDEDISLFSESYESQMNTYNYKRLLTQKYDVVITNPPYMGKRKKMNIELANFVEEYYPNSKMDLFSTFIEQNIFLTKDYGYTAFMTPSTWMYLSSYSKLRLKLLDEVSINSYIELEKSAFEDAAVPISTFVLRKECNNEEGIYIKLSKFKGAGNQPIKVIESMTNLQCEYVYKIKMNEFKNTPDNRYIYNMTKNNEKIFKSNKIMEDIAKPRQGMATSKNDYFLKYWYEVRQENIGYYMRDLTDAIESEKKWFPYNKGGGKKKWYGNNLFLLNYQYDGKEVKEYASKLYKSYSRTIKNTQYFFKKSITWSDICGNSFAARACDEGFIFDVKGSSAFTDESNYWLVLALLNSTTSVTLLNLLNPSITTQVGDIKQIPILSVDDSALNEIEKLAKQCVNISKHDWDSFEISWDFERHPLVNIGMENYDSATEEENQYLSTCFDCHTSRCRDEFSRVKAHEEELNRFFIDMYGLQNELLPEVDEKNVTIHLADKTRDIKSFISYAVGCMFGRYSLDEEGLAFAGGEFDLTKYKTFVADKDNIIPICDDEYFEDDIVGRFVEFVKCVYGSSTLEENIDFIADTLGGKGTSREKIRNYFIKDFFKDHYKIYQKRPIYWQFDSGKKNGFKALIYMHRYEADTIARMRTDYIHEQQARYRTAIEDVEYRLLSVEKGDKVKLDKQLAALKEQDVELRIYEEEIHHLADQMIEIDLDDGVKVNHAKFESVVTKIK